MDLREQIDRALILTANDFGASDQIAGYRSDLLDAVLAVVEPAIRAAWDNAATQRQRAEQAEASIARIEALHARVNTKDGKACDHCRGSDEEPIPWPCSTMAALDQPGDQEGTGT